VEDFIGGDTSQKALEYAEKKLQKIEAVFWKRVINLEKEKMYYFILSYQQRIVLIKTGEKTAEKKFLGYEFSNRRGSEGIHPIQRGKTIEECTCLFDEKQFDNPEKASTYIYKAFSGDYEYPVHNNLKENISHVHLVDMLVFDRAGFEKNISLSVKKTVKIESKWEIVRIGELCELYQPKTLAAQEIKDSGEFKVFGANGAIGFYDKFNHEHSEVVIGCRGTCGVVNYTEPRSWITGNAMVVKPKGKQILRKYLFFLLSYMDLSETITGAVQPQITRTTLEPYKIPFPPIDIQKKIVAEMEALEKKEGDIKKKIISLSGKINKFFEAFKFDVVALGNIVSFKNGLNYSRKSTGDIVNIIGVGDFQNNMVPNWDSIEQIQIEGKLSEDYILKSNDLLVVRSNGSANLVGRFLLIDNVLPNTSFSGFTIRLRPDLGKAYSKYLCYYLRTKDVREVLIKNSGGSNIKSLNQTLLSSLNIPLPPLSDQQKIVAQIERVENEILNLQIELNHFPKQKKLILEDYLKI
jgi:restriction endonuclease S subunit